MSLPRPCIDCSSDGGYWVHDTKGNAIRCTCERGVALKSMDLMRTSGPIAGDIEPKISEEAAAVGVSMLAVMKFFPSEAGARVLIGTELQAMANDEAEMLWVCRRATQLFTEWPGLPVLRAIFWSKFIPLDRRPASGAHAIFPDGVPAEVPEAPSQRALSPGKNSDDSQLDSAIKMLAERKKLN